MERVLELVANIAAALGVVLCAAAGLVRVTGSFYLLGFEALTVFVGGIALMVFACLAKLELLLRSK